MILDAVAIRFQLLPEVIDLSFVLTVSGRFAALTARPLVRAPASRRPPPLTPVLP